MDIKKRMTFAQLLSRIGGPDLSEEGIEVIVCFLEDDANHQINAAKALKEKGKIILSIGLLPFSFENKETILATLERAQLLQNTSDGCILLNKDSFIDRGCNPEEVAIQIELFVDNIEQRLQDLLREGTISVDAETLKDVLRDCGTYVVTRGVAGGLGRVECAFQNAFESASYSKLDISTARKLIIKVIVPNRTTLSNEEHSRLHQLISNLPKNIDVILGIGCSDDLAEDQIEILMLGTGLDPILDK